MTVDTLEQYQNTDNWPINKSPYKHQIAKHFDWTWNFQFLDMIAIAINRIIDQAKNGEEIEFDNEIEWSFPYNAERWILIEWYCSPENASWAYTKDELAKDLIDILEDIAKKGEK